MPWFGLYYCCGIFPNALCFIDDDDDFTPANVMSIGVYLVINTNREGFRTILK